MRNGYWYSYYKDRTSNIGFSDECIKALESERVNSEVKSNCHKDRLCKSVLNVLRKLSCFAVIASITGCSTSDLTSIVSSGNAMSTVGGKLAVENPSKVRLYYAGNAAPKHYTIVRRVSAEIYNVVGLEHTQASIADELKKQAASVGANGVINITSGMAQVTGDAVIIRK